MIITIISLEIWRSSNSLRKSAKHKKLSPKNEVPEPIPVCGRHDDHHLPARSDNLEKTSPHTTPKREKYKAYTVKEKEDVIAESMKFGIWATCRLQGIAPSTLNSQKKQDLALQHGKGKGGPKYKLPTAFTLNNIVYYLLQK